MLEYNGYSFKSDNNLLVFRHSGTDSIGLSMVIFIALLTVITLFFINPFYGLGALLLSIFIFGPIVKRSKGKSKLEIDTDRQLFKISDNHHKIAKDFTEIQGVYTHSKFVDEYSSAFKNTCKEYQVIIGLELENRKIPLFQLIADHEKPSKEANQVHNFLESVIRKVRRK